MDEQGFVELRGEDPELRAFRQRAARGESFTQAERRRYAELMRGMLLRLRDAARLAAAPVVAEVDQIGAQVRELSARLAALGEVDGLCGLGMPGELTGQLACDLLRAAERVVLYAGDDWDAPQLRAARERLDAVDEWLARSQEHHDELLAEFAEEEGGGA